MDRPASRLIYAGTYEREYPRNALTIAALRRAGFDVVEVHAPVWEHARDKTGAFLSVPSLLRAALRLAWGYASVVGRLAWQLPRADALVIGYIGQADMLVLAPLAKLLRRPVIFNPLVTLTDTLIEDRRLVARDSLLARAIGAIDTASLRLADAILVDTPENGAYLRERLGVAPATIHHVDVGADDRIFRQVTGRLEPPRTGLRVLFYGKFTPLHGIETILYAARALADQPDIRFEIIGSGQTAGEISALARQLDLQNVSFTPWVPFDLLPETIARSDVVLGIFGDTAKAARVIPNKVFQAAAMGSAIITRESPAIRRFLVDGRSALLVPPADAEALAAAIRRMRDPELRAELGRGARAAFEATGSIDALAERLASVVPAMLSTRRSPAARLESG